jgi:hypothetical protein
MLNIKTNLDHWAYRTSTAEFLSMQTHLVLIPLHSAGDTSTKFRRHTRNTCLFWQAAFRFFEISVDYAPIYAAQFGVQVNFGLWMTNLGREMAETVDGVWSLKV